MEVLIGRRLRKVWTIEELEGLKGRRKISKDSSYFYEYVSKKEVPETV